MEASVEVLRTARLVLRTWRTEDAAALHALDQDPRVQAWLPGPMSMAQAEAFIAAHDAMQRATGMCYLALEERESGALAGFVGLKRHAAHGSGALPFAPCTDIGWRLGAAYWGKGYASESAAACLRHGFDALGLAEIVSFTVPENLRSRRLMERLGMRRDPQGDFAHPALPPGHPLSRHVLYRIGR